MAVPYIAVQTVAVPSTSPPGMENPWQAYTVRAEPLQCAALEEGQKQHYGIIRSAKLLDLYSVAWYLLVIVDTF